MTARGLTAMRSFIGVVLMSVPIVGFRPVAQPQAFLADAQTTPAAPYAYMKWVKLGDLVPIHPDAEDAYVRLIAIDGEVLLDRAYGPQK